jgi:hypothetical protein
MHAMMDNPDDRFPRPSASALSALLDAGVRSRGRRRRWQWAVGVLAVVGMGFVYGLAQRTPSQVKPEFVPTTTVMEVKMKPGEAAQPGRAEAASAALISPEHLLTRGSTLSSADEARLLRVYGLLTSGEGEQALVQAQRLAAAAPDFGLAQLVYADLLSAQTQTAAGFASAPAESVALARERLDELAAEARSRVQAAAFTAPPGSVPAPFVWLDPSVKYAIAVDVSLSRVYVIENGPKGPALIREYYASSGKNGVFKQVEGDLRTPLGVYFVTRQILPRRLPARYGTQALVLNYPNPYDRLLGRTGDGIWLHGVPGKVYSRAPQTTDGCIALPNPYLEELSRFVAPQGTPIVIAEHLEWEAPADVRQHHAAFMSTFERWRAARDQVDPAAQDAFYSAKVQMPEAPALGPPWREQLRTEQQRRGANAPPIDHLSIVYWHDQELLMVVTFSETDARERLAKTRRQYWMREGESWRIFYERLLG